MHKERKITTQKLVKVSFLYGDFIIFRLCIHFKKWIIQDKHKKTVLRYRVPQIVFQFFKYLYWLKVKLSYA